MNEVLRFWKHRSFASRILVVAALAACAVWAPAFLQADAPDWLQAAARSTLPQYSSETDAAVLWSERAVSMSENGEVKIRSRRALKILRPDGHSYATVSVFFDSETRLTYFKGWTLAKDGTTHELKEKDAVDTAVFEGSLYADNRRKRLVLPAAEPGAVVGYEYEQRDRPAMNHAMWAFQEEIPVRRAQFVLELPSGWEFSPRWLHYAARDPISAKERQWVWQVEDVPALEEEDSMPAHAALAGRLSIAYFRPAGQTAAPTHNWDAIGRWYRSLTADRLQANPAIREKTAELTASATSVVDKIRALTAFAQREVRYVAIEIGIGGYRPHAAGEVFANRYGDCKDKVTLLKAMLKEAGIESHYVLVHSRRGVVAPEVATPLGFNHVIVAIRLPSDPQQINLFAGETVEGLGPVVYFDPTDHFTPFGYLPASLQGSWGLVVGETGGQVVKLPLLPASTNRLLRTGKFTFSGAGTLYGEVTELSWGAQATRRRAQLLLTPLAERRKTLEAFLARSFHAPRLVSAHAKDLEDYRHPLLFGYSIASDYYVQRAGDLLLLRPRVLGIHAMEALEGKPRRHPLEFSHTAVETDVFDLVIPEGYRADEPPAPLALKTPHVSYNRTVQVEGNTLRYTRTFQIHAVTVPPERCEELKTFFRQVAADERASIVLVRAAAPTGGAPLP